MRRFIECLLPTSICNLHCSYCYVIQYGHRKNEQVKLQYSPKIIGEALSQQRLGGVSLISITASGETMIPDELPEITSEILKQGHFVNITTNGTLTRKFDALLKATEGMHQRLHISFSFHYIELKKHNMLDTFFDNIKKVKNAGCSILLQINLVDEYEPYWDEIKELSLKNVGALPQVALTRDETAGSYKIMTSHTDKEYYDKGNEMHSPLFDYTYKYFMQKRTEYCYAGYWSGKLNLATGEMTGCYCAGRTQNIFSDLSKPIVFEPIGSHCPLKYCINSSHFISQGIIPELLPSLSYGELRNREEANWYTPEARQFLYQSMTDTNEELSDEEKCRYNKMYKRNEIFRKLRRKLKFIFNE